MTSNTTMDTSLNFSAALMAPRRSPEIPAAADVYGWPVGSWELDVLHYLVDVSAENLKGEVHFAWVLEGRAVQDLWIMPQRSERGVSSDKSRNMYGTTIRVWDAALQAWRVTWLNPVTGARDELIGRQDGKDIAQIGTHTDGTPIRWLFTEITPNFFCGPVRLCYLTGKCGRCKGNFAPDAQLALLRKVNANEER
jgi:hypothetical protein